MVKTIMCLINYTPVTYNDAQRTVIHHRARNTQTPKIAQPRLTVGDGDQIRSFHILV